MLTILPSRNMFVKLNRAISIPCKILYQRDNLEIPAALDWLSISLMEISQKG